MSIFIKKKCCPLLSLKEKNELEKPENDSKNCQMGRMAVVANSLSSHSLFFYSFLYLLWRSDGKYEYVDEGGQGGPQPHPVIGAPDIPREDVQNMGHYLIITPGDLITPGGTG